jgi:hypothetical protein
VQAGTRDHCMIGLVCMIGRVCMITHEGGAEQG